VNPDTLNLKSNGEWVTVYITLPDGRTSNIDPSTVELEGVPAAWWEFQDNVFMAKFDRATVQGKLTSLPDYEEGLKFQALTLTVTGRLSDGQPFEGTDTIRVITK